MHCLLDVSRMAVLLVRSALCFTKSDIEFSGLNHFLSHTVNTGSQEGEMLITFGMRRAEEV